MERLTITNQVLDTNLDVAILWPVRPIQASAFPLAYTNTIPIGLQVFAWGFPQGYGGQAPLLIFGYVAGKEYAPMETGFLALRMVVNAAFNPGQSGSPLLRADGSVVGVVVSRADPIPPRIQADIDAYKLARGGGIFTVTNTVTKELKVVSEGELLGDILGYLHSQVQPVIRHVVPSPALARFLQRNRIEP